MRTRISGVSGCRRPTAAAALLASIECVTAGFALASCDSQGLMPKPLNSMSLDMSPDEIARLFPDAAVEEKRFTDRSRSAKVLSGISLPMFGHADLTIVYATASRKVLSIQAITSDPNEACYAPAPSQECRTVHGPELVHIFTSLKGTIERQYGRTTSHRPEPGDLPSVDPLERAAQWRLKSKIIFLNLMKDEGGPWYVRLLVEGL